MTKFLYKHEQKQIAKLCKFHGSNFSNYNFVEFAKGPSCRANIVGILCRTNTVENWTNIAWNGWSDKYCGKLGMVARTKGN